MIYRLLWSAIAFVSLSSSAHAGFIEICKDSLPANALTGLSSFSVGGQSGIFVTPVGACTLPFQLPDGLANITELPRTGTTLSSVFTFPEDRLVSFNPITSTALVQILGGDISRETVVTFTNTPSIPEPGTEWLVGLGLAGWVLCKGANKRLSYSAVFWKAHKLSSAPGISPV